MISSLVAISVYIPLALMTYIFRKLFDLRLWLMRQSSESSALESMLFGGLAMAYSRSLNPRRLKNCLYPAWLQFCEGIIGDLKAKGVHVELHWPLCFSSEASTRSILIDLAILLPKLEPRSWILKMRASMAHATDQAQDQARCLFSMRCYAHQTSVIVIAVVGDHWKWSRMQRSNCRRRFVEERYFQHQEARLRDEATKDRGSDCESDMEDEFTDNELVDPEKPDNVDEGHIKQRAARATRREEQAAERERAAKKGNPSLEPDDKKGSQPFDHESLDDVSVRHFSEPHFEPFSGPLHARDVRTNWTRFIRLGSATSEVHMKYLSEELSTIVMAAGV